MFGREAEKKTGDLVRSCGGTKALLHFGGGSVKANGVYDWASHGIEHELSAVIFGLKMI